MPLLIDTQPIHLNKPRNSGSQMRWKTPLNINIQVQITKFHIDKEKRFADSRTNFEDLYNVPVRLGDAKFFDGAEFIADVFLSDVAEFLQNFTCEDLTVIRNARKKYLSGTFVKELPLLTISRKSCAS